MGNWPVEIEHGDAVWWMGLAIVAAGLAGHAWWRRERARRLFASDAMWSQLAEGQPGWRGGLAAVLLVGSLGLLTLGLMDFRYGETTREVPQKGIEVVFALDVSRSMLAEDVRPNRLERAKQQIRDLLDEMVGDRAGLVIFAGEAKQVVPLTSHHGDFRETLEGVDPNSLPRGGSRLGDAIETSRLAFMDKTNDHKAIVIFTDGEDQESGAVAQAEAAREEAGIRIFTVGLGDAERGARVPVGDTRSDPAPRYVIYEGEPVRSRLDGEVLQQIADAAGGAYIPAETKRVDMREVYRSYIGNIPSKEFGTARINALVPRFRWFAVPALILLCVEAWLITGGKRPVAAWADRLTRAPRGWLWIVLGVCISGGHASEVCAQEVDARVAMNEANERLRQGELAEALEAYQTIDAPNDARAALRYNEGVAYYRQSRFAEAVAAFQDASGRGDAELAVRSRYNLGNSYYQLALGALEQRPEEAKTSLRAALGHYRAVLRLDRQMSDARVNLELAARLLQTLENPPAEQPPENESAESESSESETSEEESGDESSESSSSSGTEGEQESGEQESGEQESPDAGGESGDEEQGGEQQSGEGQDQEGQSGNGQPEDEEPAGESSGEASSADEMNEPAEAPQSSGGAQDKGGDGSEGANESAGGENAGGDSEEVPRGELTAESGEVGSESRSEDVESPTAVMTREEAAKLLQAVRDRAMLRRLLQRQRERERRIPVERDW